MPHTFKSTDRPGDSAPVTKGKPALERRYASIGIPAVAAAALYAGDRDPAAPAEPQAEHVNPRFDDAA